MAQKPKKAAQVTLKNFFSPAAKIDDRPECKYGDKCYQKNEDHCKKYKHPKSVEKTESESSEDTPVQKGTKRRSEDIPVPEQSSRKRCNIEVDNDFENEECPEREDSDEIIKKIFLVKMPDDFYTFWEFCSSIDEKLPQDALKDIGWKLVGPYDVLTGQIKRGETSDEFLRHWRYYYDPPEFQTVIKGNDEGMFHIGYYRDEPSEFPVFVASNTAEKGCHFTVLGENLFAALNNELGKLEKQVDLLKKLKRFSQEHNICLDQRTPAIKARDKKVVSRTFHGAGIVVDIKNDVGYRPLTETNANLRKILNKIVSSKTDSERDKNMKPLDEMTTFVQFANDECDYGMGLELGLDLFAFGQPFFHSHVLGLLPLAYDLLKRSEFGKIIRAHLERREKSSRLSVV